MTRTGLFIAIDGIDGSGKGTQTERLVARLREAGHRVMTVSFPRYGKPAAIGVEMYLRGELGPKEAISPKVASTFYAMDRFDAAPEIRRALEDGMTVVSDRYVSSNKGHQLAKIEGEAERHAFLDWLNALEYGTLGIPKPDHTVLMNMPAEIAYDLVAKKDERAYLHGKVRDIHEMDPNFLKASQQAFLFAAAHDTTETWHVLDCVEHGHLLPIDEMHARMWTLVQGLL